MVSKTTEKGQALILIALAGVALFVFAALAIDGSRVYSEKRHAQNAADTASMAGALAYTRASESDKAVETTINNIILNAASGRAQSNGYNDDGIANEVTITTINVPDGECPGGVTGKDITVDITFHINTTFARVIGRSQVTGAVTATARACGYAVVPPFNGNPIVGLSDEKDINKRCGADSGNGDWYITGGGIFSNGCAVAHKTVDLDDDVCITTVGVADGFTGLCVNQNQTPRAIQYPNDVIRMMPPNPCDHTSGDVGIDPPAGTTTFSNGVYCISNFDALDKQDVVLNNATLYVTDPTFRLEFTGQGGFSGTGTQKGTYAGSELYHGYFIIVALHDPPCTSFSSGDQTLLIRGNSGQDIVGAIFAPSACVDLRGTSDGHAMHSQVIGYTVSSNGSATVKIQYDPDKNPKIPIYPSLTQWK